MSKASSHRSWESVTRKLAQGKTGGDPGGEGERPLDIEVPRPPPHVSTDVHVYACLVSFGPGKDVCGGRVGSMSSKFCTSPCLKGMTSCKVVAHSVKANVMFPAYFICTPKSTVAFTAPYVQVPIDASTKLAGMIKAAMSERRTLEEWTNLFAVLNGFADDIHHSDAVENISTVGRKVTIGLTPMKIRIRSDSEELDDDMLKLADSESWGGRSRDNLRSTLIDEFVESDGAIITHVRENWNKLTEYVLRRSMEMSDNDQAIRNLMEEVDVKVLKVTSLLGSPGPNASALTAWNAIQDVVSAVQLQAATSSSAMATSTSAITQVEQVKRLIEDTVLSVVDSLAEKITSLEANPTLGSSRGDASLMARLQDVETEIESLKQNRESSGVNDPNDVLSLKLMVGELTTEVAKLKVDNEKLRGELNTEQISFGGFTFTSSLSYINFVATHVRSNQWMFCYDFISIFELHSDQGRTTDESLQSNHLVGKVGYSNIQAARIDNSFRVMIPQIFGAEQDSKDPSKKMAKLVSMDIWDHPTTQSGVKEDISNFLEMSTSGLIMQVENVFHENSRASLFFTQMINSVVTFWNGLETWITRFEKELTSQMGGDNPKVHKESVWKLICWMLHAMFKEMLKRRQPGATYPAFTTGTKVSDDELRLKCASLVHGAMAAHKFMKELLSDGFIRHPIFASTMVEYLLKNKAAHASVVELATKVAQVETRVKGNQAALDKLGNQGHKKNSPQPGGNQK